MKQRAQVTRWLMALVFGAIAAVALASIARDAESVEMITKMIANIQGAK